MHKLRLVEGGKLTPGGKPTLQLTRWGRISPRKTDPSVGFPWGNPTLGLFFRGGNPTLGPDLRGKFNPGVDFPGGKISRGKSYTTIPVSIHEHRICIICKSTVISMTIIKCKKKLHEGHDTFK